MRSIAVYLERATSTQSCYRLVATGLGAQYKAARHVMHRKRLQPQRAEMHVKLTCHNKGHSHAHCVLGFRVWGRQHFAGLYSSDTGKRVAQ